MSKSQNREKFSLLKSFVALLLIAACLWAAQWQFHRGLDRHARNSIIETNSSLAPVALALVQSEPTKHEWKPVSVTGQFDISKQILLRNRYFEGVYGFELLTRFTSEDGKSFWVDCGWVKAGINALTAPTLPELPTGQINIVGRLRLDSSLPRGSFFALPADKSDGLISKANAQSNSTSENFYIDLLEGSQSSLTPAVPAQLPELSDGPHMAYALQWVFFGGLVVYGRYLIRREVLTVKEL